MGLRIGLAAFVIAFVTAIPALAASPAGTAVQVQPAASGDIDGTVIDMASGDDVFIGQRVITGSAGNVQIVFSDDTHLVVGPGSTLLISEYLLRNDRSASKFVVDALSGTFRFVTGNSPKNAYEIKTPTGTIGVRGTAFDLDVNPLTKESYLLLYHGGVDMCSDGAGCILMTESCALGVIPHRKPAEILKVNDKRQSELRGNFPYLAQQDLRRDFRLSGIAKCKTAGHVAKEESPETSKSCPPDYTGTYPDCKPPVCPPDYTGTYPDCQPPVCPPDYTGTYPDCQPPVCPPDYTGTYPDCQPPVCPPDYTGTYPDCQPPVCPPDYTGTYPDCHAPVCPPDYTGTYPDCHAPVCPPDYTGTYPDCHAPVCPPDYTGTYPDCHAPACPPDYTGSYPECEPPECPSNYSGTYPDCVPPSECEDRVATLIVIECGSGGDEEDDDADDNEKSAAHSHPRGGEHGGGNRGGFNWSPGFQLGFHRQH